MTKKRKTDREKMLYAVNIKSRKVQTPQEYIRFFDILKEENPSFPIKGSNDRKFISLENIFESEQKDKNNVPYMLHGKFSKDEIIDKDNFWDKSKKENVTVPIAKDIFYDHRYAKFYFIPSLHLLLLHVSSDIKLEYIVEYLQKAFDVTLGEDMVDVNIIIEKATIELIKKSEELLSVEASITFSNFDPTSDFDEVFETKIKDSKTTKLNLSLKAEKGESLSKEPNSLVDAILNIARKNGRVIARIKEYVAGKAKMIDTDNYPEKESFRFNEDNFITSIYNRAHELYGRNKEENEES